jgi:hypothetical protein
VSTLVAQVADELAGSALLDCFASPNPGPVSAAARPYRRFPAGALGVTFDPAGYDAIAYAIADDPQHAEAYGLACTYPGIVWFHDSSLARLQVARAAEGRDRESAEVFIEELLDKLGYRRPPAAPSSAGALDPRTYRDAEMLLTRELLTTARGAIAATVAEQAELEIDAGAAAVVPPIRVLQTAVPDPAAADIARTIVELAIELAPGPGEARPPFERVTA